MLVKKINKDEIVSVKIYDERLMKRFKFLPEKNYKIPFTNFVWCHEPSGWSSDGGRSFFFIKGKDLEHFIVRDGQLFSKPRVDITMSSGWRDDVTLYFNTKELALKWTKSNLEGITLVDVNF